MSKSEDCLGCLSFNSNDVGIQTQFCSYEHMKFLIKNCPCRTCVVKPMCNDLCVEYKNQVNKDEILYKLLIRRQISEQEATYNDEKHG